MLLCRDIVLSLEQTGLQRPAYVIPLLGKAGFWVQSSPHHKFHPLIAYFSGDPDHFQPKR